MSSPTASSIASTAFSTGCQVAAVAQQVQEVLEPSVPVQSHPIQEDSDSEGTVTPCRKRKPEGVADTPGKRCKDGAARRAPLRVVPDTESNRQSSVATSKLKGAKHGVVWSSNEKENECVDKIDKAVAANASEAVTSQHTIRSHSDEPQATPTRDSNPSLLSGETLGRTTAGDTAQETQAGSDTDSPETDSVQTNECGLDSENSAACADTMSWNQLGQTGLWQLSCDGSEAVPIPMWAGMPMHGPLLNPVPIVRNHAPGDQKILVLDMDETLIHASAQELPEFDFKVIDPFGICASKISVKKRPHVEYFLEQVAKLYKVVIFTAGTKEYATQVLDQLDPSGTLFAHRLFRGHCVLMGHFMVKDLRLITSNLSQVIIVDNTPSAYLLQRENGIHIPSYFGTDSNDCELLQLLPLLEKLADVEDVRPLIIRRAMAPCGPQFQLNPNAAAFQPIASPQPNTDAASPTVPLSQTPNPGDANQFQFNPHAAEFQPEPNMQQEVTLVGEKVRSLEESTRS